MNGCTVRFICWIILVALSSVLPTSAGGQVEPGDLVIGVGNYPPFDAGTSFGSIRAIRDGSIVEPPLDSYDTWSQGPHDLVNSLLSVEGKLVFDRGEGLAFLEDGQLVLWQMTRKVSSFVRDRGGRLYVASGYGMPVLEKFSESGESLWMTTLSQIPQAWNLTMDLARDQCTLWYSAPHGPGIFLFDVCQRTEKGMLSATPAAAIRILDDGSALVALPTGIARIDAAGHVLAEVPCRLPRTANVEFVSLSVSADLATFWVAEGTRYYDDSVVYQRNLTDFELINEYSVPHRFGAVSTMTVVPDWRAAGAPAVRRRGIRRSAGRAPAVIPERER